MGTTIMPRQPEWGPQGGAGPSLPGGRLPEWGPRPQVDPNPTKRKRRIPQQRPGYGQRPAPNMNAQSQLTALKPGAFTL